MVEVGLAKRLGVGVSGVSVPVTEKRLLVRFVEGVVKISFSLTVVEGVGNSPEKPACISSYVRFPGVLKASVLIALRGVSGGGCMVLLEEA